MPVFMIGPSTVGTKSHKVEARSQLGDEKEKSVTIFVWLIGAPFLLFFVLKASKSFKSSCKG